MCWEPTTSYEKHGHCRNSICTINDTVWLSRAAILKQKYANYRQRHLKPGHPQPRQQEHTCSTSSVKQGIATRARARTTHTRARPHTHTSCRLRLPTATPAITVFTYAHVHTNTTCVRTVLEENVGRNERTKRKNTPAQLWAAVYFITIFRTHWPLAIESNAAFQRRLLSRRWHFMGTLIKIILPSLCSMFSFLVASIWGKKQFSERERGRCLL